MKENSFQRTRKLAEETTQSAQGLNKEWWETLPMTYENWDNSDRAARLNHEKLERNYLHGNPWLNSNFNFSALKGLDVLEIGCGAGTAACLLKKGDANITAVDLTDKAIEITKANARSQGLNFEVLQMDAESLSFKNESFDYVYSWGVLHHSHSMWRAIKEVYRVLRKNGSGLVMVYNKNSFRYYVLGLYWLIIKGKLFAGDDLKSVQRYFTDGYYHRHFTPVELKSFFQKAGFSVEEVAVTHMGKKMIPFFTKNFDDFLKSKIGWLLIVKFKKAGT